MTVRRQLHALETLLRESMYWRLDAPQAAPTASTAIFMDTMEPAGMAAMGTDPTYACPT